MEPCRRQIVEIDVDVAVDIRDVGQRFSIRREASALDFPFVLREPVNLFGGDIEQPNVVVSVGGVRCDLNIFAIGRDVGRFESLLAFVRRKQRVLRSGNIDRVDVGFRAFGLLLRVRR